MEAPSLLCVASLAAISHLRSRPLASTSSLSLPLSFSPSPSPCLSPFHLQPCFSVSVTTAMALERFLMYRGRMEARDWTGPVLEQLLSPSPSCVFSPRARLKMAASDGDGPVWPATHRKSLCLSTSLTRPGGSLAGPDGGDCVCVCLCIFTHTQSFLY